MFGFSDLASILGFITHLVFDPIVWLFLIFWIVFGITKKRWAKIAAIVFSCLMPLALFMAWFTSTGLSRYLLGNLSLS